MSSPLSRMLAACVASLMIHDAEAFASPRIGETLEAFQSSSLASSQQKWHDGQANSRLVESLFADDSSSNGRMIPLALRGQGSLNVSSSITGIAREGKRTVLFLSTDDSSTESVPSLLFPLKSAGELKLVSFAAAERPLSKSLLLTLNGALVNRDGALFDNLPWSQWSVDPQRRNRDASGNVIDPKFHLGKRDAYYRFMGKDWQGRSIAMGNIALRLKYMLENDDDDGGGGGEADADQSRTTLAKRILQLQLREIRMDHAGIEAKLAAADEGDDESQLLLVQKLELEQKIATMENDLEQVESNSRTSASFLAGILENVAKWSTNDGKNAAPYRGASGYAPILDTKGDLKGSVLPYTSPFDLLKEILEDQLNAKVVGCVLENTSLLGGNVVLGGAVVLQRIVPTTSSKIMGEEVTINDYDEDYGNPNSKGGEVMIVECDGDEAIGMSLACDVDLSIESTLYETNAVLSEEQIQGRNSEHIMDTLAVWKATGMEISLQVEGERQGSPRLSPISMPGAFDEMPSESRALFPVDSPVMSLDEYDRMSNEEKAKTLLEMSNFSGRLPRPRVVRQAGSNPLDDLLIPLIDESVRRQFRIREAESRGDRELANELRASKSKRQDVLERAEIAREDGQDDLAARLESESEFLESLRADITQDEGAYNRFLDRDDWYERDRQAAAKRAKKSSFGTLLDGIE